MSNDIAALEDWWERLTPEQREELLPLQEGDALPSGHLAGLTEALGVGPVGTKWEHEPGYTFTVDERLADFLARQREGLD